VKTGAEGVFCAAIPELGLGVAVKCEDGAGRASESAISAVLASLFARHEPLAAKLSDMARPEVRNWRGTVVGNLRPAGALAG
jgi:L-asparaginase II